MSFFYLIKNPQPCQRGHLSNGDRFLQTNKCPYYQGSTVELLAFFLCLLNEKIDCYVTNNLEL